MNSNHCGVRMMFHVKTLTSVPFYLLIHFFSPNALLADVD